MNNLCMECGNVVVPYGPVCLVCQERSEANLRNVAAILDRIYSSLTSAEQEVEAAQMIEVQEASFRHGSRSFIPRGDLRPCSLAGESSKRAETRTAGALFKNKCKRII